MSKFEQDKNQKDQKQQQRPTTAPQQKPMTQQPGKGAPHTAHATNDNNRRDDKPASKKLK